MSRAVPHDGEGLASRPSPASRVDAAAGAPGGNDRQPIAGARQPIVQMVSVVVAVAAITLLVHARTGPKSEPKAGAAEGALAQKGPAESSDEAHGAAPVEADRPIATESSSSRTKTGPTATPTAPAERPDEPAKPDVPPEPDRNQVAAAEASLDAASRDRARADARASEASRRLAQATAQAALDASRARKLAFLVRDPSTRISQASARGGFLQGERDKLAKEVTTLRQLPRPKAISIIGKSPVARPASNDEYHFELWRNRVSYINLTRLLDLTKSDAQVRIRMSDRAPEITSKVGPVGSFSLAYELLRATPGSVEELIERKSVRFDLRAWELIPESINRGETYEATKNPISEFARAVNRMSPGRSTVTFWVYPDSFALYRRLRDDLISRGFSVAGRPLPEGMTIRGSPLGTQSAAQ
jgi:hypothetical protein